jgi:hypothetical protein
MLLVAVPFPNCPTLLFPQQRTVPSASTAQAWVFPTATLVALVMPLTRVGRRRWIYVLSPIWPLSFCPQQ